MVATREIGKLERIAVVAASGGVETHEVEINAPGGLSQLVEERIPDGWRTAIGVFDGEFIDPDVETVAALTCVDTKTTLDIFGDPQISGGGGIRRPSVRRVLQCPRNPHLVPNRLTRRVVV